MHEKRGDWGKGKGKAIEKEGLKGQREWGETRGLDKGKERQVREGRVRMIELG